MSFAYKKIPPSNISSTPYISNKKFIINNNEISGSGITFHIGEYLPTNQINFFDPKNDDKTSNNEYKRLIYDSINHLYYKNFQNSVFYTSSAYEFYPQTTLSSGSYTTTLRDIDRISGSSFQGVNSIYNANVVYDSIFLYDDVNYNSNKGSLINVISIDKKLFGSKINPKSFSIIFDEFYIKDDGEGNVFDYQTENNYLSKIEQNIPGEIFIGNIIYSHGLIIITNQDYICILDSPPIAVNDYYSFYNNNITTSFDITANDYSDCKGIDYSTLTLVPQISQSFPDCFLDNGLLKLTVNQNSYIPGEYILGYTIDSNNGLTSNVGLINLVIKENPFEIQNFSNTTTCPGITSPISISFDIFGGTPEYSYSWDGLNYIDISGFENISLSGSILSTTSSFYVKDYNGRIISQSFNPYFIEPTTNIITTQAPYCTNTGSINIISEDNYIYYINSASYNTNQVYQLITGSYTASLEYESCIKLINFEITSSNQLTASIDYMPPTCYGGNNGTININNITGGKSPYFIYNNSISSSQNINNLSSGSYLIEIEDADNCVFNTNIILTPPNIISASITSSYENICFSAIEINPIGGTPPYTYVVSTPQSVYSSDINIINLYADVLNNYTASVVVYDSNNCSVLLTQEIQGRKYQYSGSYCEQI